MTHGTWGVPGARRMWAALGMLAALALAGVARAADVDIALVRMGVGSHVRPGDPTAILVRVTSSLEEPVQARVQWAVRNADGDLARYSRDIALAPGAPVEKWIYGVMPISEASAQASIELVSVVRVLQINDGRVLRVLGERRIDGASAVDTPTPVETTESLIGVVGDGRAGLAALATPTPKTSVICSMNELTRIARGIDAAGLPDRWEGLASFQAMIWTNAATQNLSIEQGRALLDWTRRGGNLVIVLPESGDPWGIAAQRGRTPLGEILPTRAKRQEAVLVERLLPILSKTDELRNRAARSSIWTFEPGASDGYEPLLLLPARVDPRTGIVLSDTDPLDGAVVAVRRSLGFGFVTVIGIDVDGLDRRALAADGIPQADIFWNRVLGRRADAPGPGEWAALETAQRLNSKETTEIAADGGALVTRMVGMRSEAAIGVLALVGAFGLYWIIAGPGSYWALRMMKKPQYAWLAFVAVAGAATTVAWALTGLSELTSGRVQHLSFVDRIDGFNIPAEQRRLIRVNSWLSAALPGYGGAKLALVHGEGAAGSDAIWTFFPPPAGNQSGFPDVETYEVPSTSPNAYEVPSRATATVLMTAWMGAASTEWDGLPTVMRDRPLRQDVTWGASPRVMLQGSLVHQLPVPLKDVQLIYVNPFRPPDRRIVGTTPPLISPSDMMPSYARIVRLPTWAPGTALDVGNALFKTGDGEARSAPARDLGTLSVSQDLFKRFREKAAERDISGYIDTRMVFDDQEQLAIRMFYGMLTPPEYLTDATRSAMQQRRESVRFQRDFGRQLDLGAWFSQPCLIVIGRVEHTGSKVIGMPMPFTIDGGVPEASGTTYVRVIFPLPAVAGAMVPTKAERAAGATSAAPVAPAAPAAPASAADPAAPDAPAAP